MRIKISRYKNGKFETVFNKQVLVFNISRKSEQYMMIEYKYYNNNHQILSAYFDYLIDDDIVYVSRY